MDRFKYKWVVESDNGLPDCPLFTVCTKTKEEAEQIRTEQRFLEKKLNVVVRPIEEMRGLNPYYAPNDRLLKRFNATRAKRSSDV